MGLERAGMECAGQVEKDPYCLSVLAYHWPDVKRIGDVYDVKEDSFGPVGLICGGFPCQPFSCAGKRKGKEDDRYIWPEMLRIIKVYRPTWVLGENVAGIIGMELDAVLADLETAGYEVQSFVIPACAVDAPHRRDRVWIVGYSASERGRADSETGLGMAWQGVETPERVESSNAFEVSGYDVAYAEIGTERTGLCAGESGGIGRGRSGNGGGADVSDADITRLEKRKEQPTWEKLSTTERICHWQDENKWFAQSGMGRLAHGISNRMAQLRALGNAVVPQVVEKIGRAIMNAEKINASY